MDEAGKQIEESGGLPSNLQFGIVRTLQKRGSQEKLTTLTPGTFCLSCQYHLNVAAAMSVVYHGVVVRRNG